VFIKENGLKAIDMVKAKYLSIMEAFTKEILSMGLNTGTDECIIQAATFMKGHGRRIRSTGKE
jgi:hypothetical protein